MAVDAGEVDARDGDYFGRPLNRVARLLAAGHGGQVLVSTAAAELVRDTLPPGSSLIGLGVHHLRDFAEPQEIHQLAAPDLPSAFPALRTLSTNRGNLPARVTSFVGRETEIEEIKSLLENNRVVTLVGSGGVGKTSTSLKVGADIVSRFQDGAWFVELAPLTNPHLIPEIIAGLFNAPIGTGSAPIEALTSLLREKRALLILDNCEHLVAAIASLAETIIRSCPNISILATSREPLAIAGETIYRMPSLTFPERTDSITADEALSYSAVQLFAVRAGAAVNGFVVANDNAPAVAEICRRLDGIALAIELAAPRLKMIKPRELANRLDDQFRILTGGSRTALPRQQTLRAAIDWSYDLLSDAERTLLRRLSVFAGGCTMEGAAEVAADHRLQQLEIFDLMASLVDKSLVVADASGPVTRYRLLESTRQYAAEKLTEAGETGWQRRLAEYLVAYYARAVEEWPTAPTRAWIETYSTELDNLRASLEWAFGHEGDVSIGLDLVGYSMRLLFEICLFPELIRWVDIALAHIGDRTPPATAARVWLAKNFSINAMGNPIAAAASRRAVELCRGGSDPYLLGLALTRTGAALMSPDNWTEGQVVLREARAILEPLGQTKYLAECLCFLGTDFSDHPDDYEAARQFMTEAATMHRALGDTSGLWGVLNNFAEMEFAHGNPERSIEMAQEILEAAANERYRVDLMMLTRSNLAGYLLALQRIDEAEEAAKASIRETRSVGGRPNYIVCALEHLAVVAAERRQFELAARLLGYLDRWYETNTDFFRDLNEQKSCLRTRALLAAALSDKDRERLMREGAGWSEDKASEEGLAI